MAFFELFFVFYYILDTNKTRDDAPDFTRDNDISRPEAIVYLKSGLA